MEENIKKIPYGVSNFVTVVEQNQYYVDKTMYSPLLEEQPVSLFFIRPRRFGKSIFLSMLETITTLLRSLSSRPGSVTCGWAATPRSCRAPIRLSLDFLPCQ